eukprot:8104320-Alexandrium_andersonii.AAC.1
MAYYKLGGLDIEHLKLGHRPHDTYNCSMCGEAALQSMQHRRQRGRQGRGVISGDLAVPWPETLSGDICLLYTSPSPRD